MQPRILHVLDQLYAYACRAFWSRFIDKRTMNAGNSRIYCTVPPIAAIPSTFIGWETINDSRYISCSCWKSVAPGEISSRQLPVRARRVYTSGAHCTRELVSYLICITVYNFRVVNHPTLQARESINFCQCCRLRVS